MLASNMYLVLRGDYVLQFINKITNSKSLSSSIILMKTMLDSLLMHMQEFMELVASVPAYNVGALKLCNAVAGAYAERSPVIVISGSPGIRERNEDFYFIMSLKALTINLAYLSI
jgi:indolepyruvate decarboxylase